MCEKCGNIDREHQMDKYKANKKEILTDLVDRIQMGFVLIVLDDNGNVSMASNIPQEAAKAILQSSIDSFDNGKIEEFKLN